MPKPYDAVTKHLIDLHPADWLALVGVAAPDAEAFDVELVDSDLSTVTSQADRVLRINGPYPGLFMNAVKFTVCQLWLGFFGLLFPCVPLGWNAHLVFAGWSDRR